MPKNNLVEALLDIYDRVEDAEDSFKNIFSDLENVLSKEIVDEMNTIGESLHFIERIVTNAIGGTSKLMLLQDERDQEE